MNQPSVPQGLFVPGGVSPPQPRPRQRLPPRRRTAVRVAPVGADEAPTFCLEEQVAPSELPRQGCLFKAPKGSWDVEPDLIRQDLLRFGRDLNPFESIFARGHFWPPPSARHGARGARGAPRIATESSTRRATQRARKSGRCTKATKSERRSSIRTNLHEALLGNMEV